MWNEIIIDKIIYKLECVWRKTPKDKSRDIRGNLFPLPKKGNGWSDSKYFVEKLEQVEAMLDLKYLNSKNDFLLDKTYDCYLCEKKNIITKRYNHSVYIWDDGLKHYITEHNIQPSDKFIDVIRNIQTNKSAQSIKLKGKIKKSTSKISYIKLKHNQIMIIDALMKHGGYTKKYNTKTNIYKYSEHTGMLDIHGRGFSKIIISGNSTRAKDNDDEIFFPNDLPDTGEYEYMFHTHPPTPKPGGRAIHGILYEIPSIGDMFNFIEFFNSGKTIGSIIITPEGLYNIRKTSLDKKKIIIDDDAFYKIVRKTLDYNHKLSLEKYSHDFSHSKYHSVIAQDFTFVNNLNMVLKDFQLAIDFFPRKKNSQGSWVITDIYLPIFN